MRHPACEFIALWSYQRASLSSTGVTIQPSSTAQGPDLPKSLLCSMMNSHPLCTSGCLPRAGTCCFSSSCRKNYRNQMLLSVFLQCLFEKPE